MERDRAAMRTEPTGTSQLNRPRSAPSLRQPRACRYTPAHSRCRLDPAGGAKMLTEAPPGSQPAGVF